MPFCAYDGQTACIFGFFAEFDIGPPTGHIGSDRHRSGSSCFGYDLCLFLVEFGVEHIVVDLPKLQRPAEQFRDLDIGRSHQHRPTVLGKADDLIDHGVELLSFGLVDQIFTVVPYYGPVRWDHYHIELIDVPEFTCFCLRRTCHARQLVVHAEIILKRNGGVGLRRGFDLHIFLGLYGLVESVGVAPTFHDPSGLLIDDLDLVVHHHIFNIFLKDRVGLQKLIHGVDALALEFKIAEEFLFFLGGLLCVESEFFNACHFCGQVGKNEEIFFGIP